MRAAKRQRQEQRAERRAANQCLICGSYALTHNADGTRSKYCADHKPRHSGGRHKTPVVIHEVDLDYDYRDTQEFIAYRNEIHRLFNRHRRLSVPEIHRLVIEPKRRWTMDVLDTLDLIEHGVGPVKYELFVPVERQLVYNNTAVFGARV